MERAKTFGSDRRDLLLSDAQLEQRPTTALVFSMLDDDRGSRRLAAGRNITDIVLANPGAAQAVIVESYQKPHLAEALKNSEKQPLPLDQIRETYPRTVKFFDEGRMEKVLAAHPLTESRVNELKAVLAEIDPTQKISSSEVVLRLLSEDGILHGRDKAEWLGILDSHNVYSSMQDELIEANEHISDSNEDTDLINMGQNLLLSVRILTEHSDEDADLTQDLKLHSTPEKDYQGRMAQLRTISVLCSRIVGGSKNETLENILKNMKQECEAIYDHILRIHPQKARSLGGIVGAIRASAWIHDESINYLEGAELRDSPY